MASAKNNESSNTSESFGVVIADVLQEQMLNSSEYIPQTAVSSVRGDINDIDNLIFPNSTDNSRITTTNDTLPSGESTIVQTATSVVQAIDELENRLSSVCNQNNTSIGSSISENAPERRSSTPTGQLQAQSSNTTDSNESVKFPLGQHIMMSYHHVSSFDICQRICDRLRERGYRIWMDTNNLHGSIHQGMAEAVENAYIVLFCINHQYSQSEYCKKEALYTDKRHIDFIPCLLEPSYEPQGWLGIVIRDQLYIDFSAPDNFDTAFAELVAEVQAVEDRLQISSIQRINSSSDNNSQSMEVISGSTMDLSLNTQTQYNSLRAVIQDFRESINQSNHDAQSMTEEEFSQFVGYIRQRVFPDTLTLPLIEHNNSREILEDILRHTRNQTEFLRRITEILSSITETRTIIKLSLAFVFVWTMGKFLKYK